MFSDNSGKADKEIINDIQRGGHPRRKALAQLYQRPKWRLQAAKLVQSQGRNKEDFKDIYQDAFLILERNIRNKTYAGKGSLKAYFLGIIRGTCHGRRRSRNNDSQRDQGYIERTNDQIGEPLTPEEILIRKNNYDLIRSYLKQLGVSCEKALILRAEGFTMKEIAGELGYSNYQSAKNTVSRCREKFLEKFGDLAPDHLDMRK